MTAKAQYDSCQLYLVAEALAGEGTHARLSAALSTAPIASVLFVPPESDAGGQFSGQQNEGAAYADFLRPLITLVQDHGAAALILNEPGLAKSLKADGIHVSAGAENDAPLALLKEARSTLPANIVAGADAGSLRDSAMQLGELGADYVGFACTGAADNLDAAQAEQLQLVAWWAEIFLIPCVAFDVQTPSHAKALARAGADFVAIKIPADKSAASVRDYVNEFCAALAAAKPKG